MKIIIIKKDFLFKERNIHSCFLLNCEKQTLESIHHKIIFIIKTKLFIVLKTYSSLCRIFLLNSLSIVEIWVLETVLSSTNPERWYRFEYFPSWQGCNHLGHTGSARGKTLQRGSTRAIWHRCSNRKSPERGFEVQCHDR